MGIFDLLGTPKKKDRDLKPKPKPTGARSVPGATRSPHFNGPIKSADKIPTKHSQTTAQRNQKLARFILDQYEDGLEIPEQILTIAKLVLETK